jgi:hypothetical protein
MAILIGILIFGAVLAVVAVALQLKKDASKKEEFAPKKAIVAGSVTAAPPMVKVAPNATVSSKGKVLEK